MIWLIGLDEGPSCLGRQYIRLGVLLFSQGVALLEVLDEFSCGYFLNIDLRSCSRSQVLLQLSVTLLIEGEFLKFLKHVLIIAVVEFLNDFLFLSVGKIRVDGVGLTRNDQLLYRLECFAVLGDERL